MSMSVAYHKTPISECCRFLYVYHNENSTHVYDRYKEMGRPDIFQFYEIQPELVNDRPYYVPIGPTRWDDDKEKH